MRCCLLDIVFTQSEIKPETTFGAIGNGDGATMKQYGVFYDGKTEACATLLAGATLVYTVEALEEVGQMFHLHTLTIILKADTTLLIAVFEQRYIDVLTLRIGYGILC